MLLADWWRDRRLPAVDELTSEQATFVLAQIDALEWSGRPFGPNGA
jgi:hypothetical protein